MALFVPQIEVSLLPTSQYHDRLKMLCRNTPSKPWIRDYDDPVQLIWASLSELRSQHSQPHYHNQKQQIIQKSHKTNANISSSSLSSSSTAVGATNSSRSTPTKEKEQGLKGKKSKKRSRSEEHEVYVISPSSADESNVYVNNKPVTLTAAENRQVELSPKLLPSAITREHAQIADNDKNIDVNAEISRVKEPHLYNNQQHHPAHNLLNSSSESPTHSTRLRKKVKKESTKNVARPAYVTQNANEEADNTYSAETNSEESWENVQELHSQEQSKKHLEHYTKNVDEPPGILEMENGIEFTPSSAEVREGSVEILSSPPPVITIRQRRTKSSQKKASNEDGKVRTRQRRSSKNKVTDNDKVQLPMERFLRRV